jgi:abortive infection bacteriophage resistance protein
MRYDKPPLTISEQADLLLSRGLIADKEVLLKRLTAVNYYRLSSYLYPFRTSNHHFQINTTFEVIWSRYTFDRQLRLILLDAIERVEISLRTKLSYYFSLAYGPFAYLEPKNLPRLSISSYAQWLFEFTEEIKRSKEPFIVHFNGKYGDTHEMPPLWMAVEVMSFGKTLTMFRGLENEMKQKIASCYDVSDEIFLSWLVTLNSVRNICAHHGRTFDRKFDYQPKIPREQKYPEWHNPVKIPSDKVFGILTILNYILRFDAPTSQWLQRLYNLLENRVNISLYEMGFPENWNDSPLWKK